jgi:glycosyltransferase involved in cell wall biosynthesis
MKILQLAQLYPPVIGGEERHVHNLARMLATRGHEVHVATQALDGRPTPSTDEDGVTVHRLSSLGARLPVIHEDPERPHALPMPDPFMTIGLRKLIAEIQPDVIHAHNWIVNSVLPAEQRSQRPLLMTLHSYSQRCANTRLIHEGEICTGPAPKKCLSCAGDHYGRGKGAVMVASTALTRRWKENRVDRFIPVSGAVARGAGLEAAGLPFEVVPNFIPDALLEGSPELSPRPDYLPSDDFFLFVGDLTRDKGVFTLLKAYAALKAPKPNLLMVGRPSPELPSTLPEGVVLAHHWPHEQIVAAFRNCVAAALPSEWADPCPTTVLEAMALGAPLVTTPVGGIVDMVDEDSALLVEPGNAAEMTLALGRLSSDQALRERLSAEATERVKSFTASKVVSRIEETYDELLFNHAVAKKELVAT